jgi:hypothetical protein
MGVPPVWSPDGSQLLAEQDGRTVIISVADRAVRPLEGSEHRNLVDPAAVSWQPLPREGR